MPEKALCWKRFQPSAWESKDSYAATVTGQGVDIGPVEVLLGLGESSHVGHADNYLAAEWSAHKG